MSKVLLFLYTLQLVNYPLTSQEVVGLRHDRHSPPFVSILQCSLRCCLVHVCPFAKDKRPEAPASSNSHILTTMRFL